MALIPVDVGLRLRTQPGETPLASVAAVQEIAADLPQLGQAFTARIQDILPDNTYRALVAGKSVTLALPQGAEAGDVLELVVVDRTPRLLVARMADPALAPSASAAGSDYPHATFSATARMIGQLLPEQGQSPAPATLNGGRPLLATAEIAAQPDALAAQLAPRLERAVRGSGLFYEAHQAQWLTGKVSTETLLAEPQNRQVDPGNGLRASATTETAASTAASSTRLAGETGPTTATSNAVQAPASPVPEALRPLVQQQLDAAATQRLMWHGEVWPDQSMEWEVQRDSRSPTPETPDTEGWNTRLGLTMPQLGRVDARLNLEGSRLRLNLHAGDSASLATLRARLPELEASLAAAGLRLDVAQVSMAPAETAHGDDTV